MNLENMVEGRTLEELKGRVKKIFFYRICGTGMGACACLAKEAGYQVEGADLGFSPPMSTYLNDSGIPLHNLDDLDHETLQNFDLIIVGNVVAGKSDYARFIEESRVPFTSFPSFLGEFILKDKEVIGLSGTHGKTTTTYFLTQMLEALGEDTGYFIGGIIDGRAPSRFGKSKFFAIEADEYDSCYFQKISKFRLYNLSHLIITSLEFDHADIFDSIDDIKKEFSASLKDLPGEVIFNDEYPALKDLEQKFDHDENWIEYGKSSTVGPRNIRLDNKITFFDLDLGGKTHTFRTNIIGDHNILNITSCLLLLLKKGFSVNQLIIATEKLGLVKRRQEYRGLYKKAVVIDDFAHHPRAIDLTIKAIRESYPDKKIITIFEPISATARSQIFQHEFEVALETSDEVILAINSLKTTVGSGNNLDGNKIVSNLNTKNIPSHGVETLSELRSKIDELASSDKLFLILSNKNCLGLWESDFVQNLD